MGFRSAMALRRHLCRAACACLLFLAASLRAEDPAATGFLKRALSPTGQREWPVTSAQPDPLNRLLDPQKPAGAAPSDSANNLMEAVFAPPLGYAGPSGVYPRSGGNQEYDTVEDRWRIGFPEWDRY